MAMQALTHTRIEIISTLNVGSIPTEVVLYHIVNLFKSSFFILATHSMDAQKA